MTRRVYLDHNASTPVHPEVVAEMLPYFSDVYGNPSSVHGFGRDARAASTAARATASPRFCACGRRSSCSPRVGRNPTTSA